MCSNRNSHIPLVGENHHFVAYFFQYPLKLNMYIFNNPAISVLGVYSKKLKYVCLPKYILYTRMLITTPLN